MKRLTQKDEQGNWCIQGLPWKERIYAAFRKLLEYENTGLTPDEINALRERDKNDGWIPVEERLPDESDGLVLIQVNGKPKGNITLHNALEFAFYIAEGNEGWILEEYPEWKNPDVIAWRPLPEPYQSEQTAAKRPEWQERMLHTFLGGHA